LFAGLYKSEEWGTAAAARRKRKKKRKEERTFASTPTASPEVRSSEKVQNEEARRLYQKRSTREAKQEVLRSRGTVVA